MILSIIIPAFNEEKTILKLLDKVISVDLGSIKKEIIIVNDCSSDNTQNIVEDFINQNKNISISLYSNETNKGKGFSLNNGIKKAKGDIIIFQDADLEYDIRDYKNLLLPFMESNADVVYGSRFLGYKYNKLHHFSH